MRYLFTSILILFLLAACGTSAPQTSEVSATQTPSLTPTPTFTPTTSVTPTPTVPAEYMEVYKYLDSSFVLETGTANAEGVRKIITTNQFGEKVAVATVDASGNVAIGDVLKYKPVDFNEPIPTGEAVSQLLTLEQVKQGLLRENTLLNVEVPEFDADTVLPDGLILVRDQYQYKEDFKPDPNKPLFKVLAGYYVRNDVGAAFPVLTIAWDRGVDEDPAIITTIYRSKETLERVMTRVNSGKYDPLPVYPAGYSKYYVVDNVVTDRINPYITTAQDPKYVEVYKVWAEDGIPPEFTSDGETIVIVGRLPNS